MKKLFVIVALILLNEFVASCEKPEIYSYDPNSNIQQADVEDQSEIDWGGNGTQTGGGN